MALLFNSSTPQSMKDKKLYDDDSKFTNDDLQDVLDGLLKLHVSNVSNNNNNRIRPIVQVSSVKKKKAVKPRTNNSGLCPNRHNPKYQREPTFIASSLKPKKPDSVLSGINLLFEAAKRVEGRSNFLMDVSQINSKKRVTRFEDIEDQITFNEETGVMKKKSKNGISPPKHGTFKHSPNKQNSLLSISSPNIRNLSDISSIGRQSFMHTSSTNPYSGMTPKEQQRENRRISREWSNRNIMEMDQMYHDKSKLAQKLEFESQNDASANNKLKHLTNSSILICKEFSESNNDLNEVINEHKQNLHKIREYHQKRELHQQQQNKILKQQLVIMEEKIKKQQEREQQIAKRKEEHEAQKRQQLQAVRAKAEAQTQQQQQQQHEQQIKEQLAKQQQAQLAKQQQIAMNNNNNNNKLHEKKEWYRNEEKLSNMYKHYKSMYKQCDDLVEQMEQQLQNKNDMLEMKIGLILPAIRANQKSVFEAFKRFQRIVNERKDQEKQYAFIKLTKLIICDVSLIKSSAQKFASAYFLSFIMNEYQNEYLEIFKCVFYGECLWCLPHIDKQLKNLAIKQRDFNPFSPSIVRCVVLKYRNIKDLNDVPSEKQKYLQQFTKEHNAGKIVFEAEKTYFDRIQGICGLFAAFMAIRNNKTFCNPFGIDSSDCWQWIAHLLCLPQCVYPELCSILSSIIQIIGHEMLEKYPNQFPKIIAFIKNNIFEKCDESTTTRSKARRELNLFLRECNKNQNNGRVVINKPAESKLIAKTVGASALTNIRQ